MDAMDVEWTSQNVYIQAYEEEIKDYNDDDQGSIYQTKDDDTSCDLYCMDLDGKNIEKIADQGMQHFSLMFCVSGRIKRAFHEDWDTYYRGVRNPKEKQSNKRKIEDVREKIHRKTKDNPYSHFV